jgi:hypothetical protein
MLTRTHWMIVIAVSCLLSLGPAGCGGGEGGEDAQSDADALPDPTDDRDGDGGLGDVRDAPPPDGAELPGDLPPDVATETAQECDGNCRYVREGAGGSNDGSDWTNAWTQLPDALARGTIYFIADGHYPGYTFDDEASGSDAITVVRATGAAHGTDAGWEIGFGEGRAVFGPLVFTAPYTIFDGREGRGIEAVGGYQDAVVSIGADNVTVRNVEMNGNFTTDAGGYHVDGVCTGLDISASNVTVSGCEIHDAADDGVSISGSRHVDFSGNVVHRLHGCGTDGGCGPCYNGHSDGLEIYNVKDSSFTGNLVYDVRSTSTFFFGNWADSLGGGPDEYCGNITMANNILYSPDTGFVAYIQDVAGVKVFSNVFWGLRQGRYGGLSIGLHVTDMDMFNNVILSLNNEHVGGTYDAANHRHDYNLIGVSLGQIPEGPHDIVNPDPGFTAIPAMDGPAVADPPPESFALAAGSPCIDAGYPGDASILIPATDFFGSARDSSPDIGAVEYIP